MIFISVATHKILYKIQQIQKIINSLLIELYYNVSQFETFA